MLDSFKPKEFADDNFEFDESGRKFSKRVENNLGKGVIAGYEQFLLLPQCFRKTSTTDTLKPGLVLGKGLVIGRMYLSASTNASLLLTIETNMLKRK